MINLTTDGTWNYVKIGLGNLIDIDDIDVTYIDVTYMNDMNVLYNGFYIDRKGLKVPYLICKILQLLKFESYEAWICKPAGETSHYSLLPYWSRKRNKKPQGKIWKYQR